MTEGPFANDNLFLLMTPEEFKDAVRKLGGATRAARSLGISTSTVYRWMKSGIKAENGNYNYTKH